MQPLKCKLPVSYNSYNKQHLTSYNSIIFLAFVTKTVFFMEGKVPVVTYYLH